MMTSIVINERNEVDRLTSLIASRAGVDATPELAESVRIELSQLPDLDGEVLRARFGVSGERPSLLAEIAAHHPGVTTHRILLIEKRGMESLRRRLLE
jgi:DNA-directed RNA polymerase sigma subunit (sigma70/sigma32)